MNIYDGGNGWSIYARCQQVSAAISHVCTPTTSILSRQYVSTVRWLFQAGKARCAFAYSFVPSDTQAESCTLALLLIRN